MQSSQSTSTALDLADGPTLADTELGVHLIYVPESCARDLSEIMGCVGNPDPTDVVVWRGHPYHCAGLSGHKKEPRSHPQVHVDFPQTVLVVTAAKNQSVVWWSETEFCDVTIGPSHDPNRFFPEAKTDRPDDPFPTPIRVTTEICNGRTLYVIRSGVPIPDAVGHMYKIEFSMENQTIDPDMYCGLP